MEPNDASHAKSRGVPHVTNVAKFLVGVTCLLPRSEAWNNDYYGLSWFIFVYTELRASMLTWNILAQLSPYISSLKQPMYLKRPKLITTYYTMYSFGLGFYNFLIWDLQEGNFPHIFFLTNQINKWFYIYFKTFDGKEKVRPSRGPWDTNVDIWLSSCMQCEIQTVHSQ